jgi:hypothetical protein
MACFDSLSSAYLGAVTWEPKAEIEARTATLLPGLLLARVDGKSPVEYLDAAGQARVRSAAVATLERGEQTLAALKDAWQRSST